MTTEDRSILSRPAPGPDRVVAYGSHPDQVVELRDGPGDGPLVVLLHGGFWRPEFDRAHLRPLVDALARDGRSVASVEYRRIPGDPDATATDVAAGLAAAARDGRGDGRIALAGHSAGGHLAMWASVVAPPPGLVGTVALAPVSDLVGADRLGLGGGAVRAFLGADPADRPDLDPLPMPAAATPVTVVHGALDDRVPIGIARTYRQAQPETRLVELPDAGHFALIDPGSTAWPVLLRELDHHW